MRKGMCQPGQQPLTATEKIWRGWQGSKLYCFFNVADTISYSFLKTTQELFSGQGAGHCPNTFPIMIHGQDFHIIA